MPDLIAIFRLLATALTVLCLSSPAASRPSGAGMDATVDRSGWYLSSASLHSVKFVDPYITTAADETPVERDGRNEITVPNGLGGNTAKFKDIDKTTPSVGWNSAPNTQVTADSSGLSAEISDQESGICLIELSIDKGRSWLEGWSAAGFALKEPLKETTWTYHPGFRNLAPGPHPVILRAQDCAGNISPGEILMVRMNANR